MGFSDSVIIFHPGSRHLYFGRSSDPKPQSILHVIARRRSQSQTPLTPPHHRDTLLPLSEKRLTEQVPHEVQSARLQLALTLQSTASSILASSSEDENDFGGAKLTPKQLLTDVASLVAFNKCSKPVVSVASTATSLSILTDEHMQRPFIVGEDVLKIQRDDPFNIHCPWRRGQLNLHREVGGSITSVIQDMEDIWRWCVTEKLGISAKDLTSYDAVVVVPVMFDRVHAKELMSLIINRLGFQRCYFLQDHICASFGAGMSCCTVVDVGDQKISVSCVEDGVSYPHSRLELKYGGGDLTIALWNQLRLTSFPIPVGLADPWDCDLLNQLKETRCHLNVKSWISRGGGAVEDAVIWTKPGGKNPLEYRVKFGDELMVVPLSYFNPDLLRGSIGRKAVILYGPQPTIPDDPHDQNFLADTACKRSRRDSADDCGGDEETTTTSASVAEENSSNVPSVKSDAFNLPLGIDQAILQSIEMCNIPNDLKRRLFSTILVVGGGFKISGLKEWLTDRLKLTAPKYLQNDEATDSIFPSSVNPKIFTCAADYKNLSLSCSASSGVNDSAVTTWKGAAILSSLETAKELWITRKEWDTHGSKILREKSLFHY